MCQLVSLDDLLQILEENIVIKFLGYFTCSKNKDLENFLHSKAIKYEKSSNTRTFLFIENKRIQGFFSLALNILDVSLLSNTQIKKLNPKHSKDVKYLPCLTIGQLGKSDDSSIKGKYIMESALKILYDIHKHIGSRFVLIDAVNYDKIVAFYEKYGFLKLGIGNKDSISMIRFFA